MRGCEVGNGERIHQAARTLNRRENSDAADLQAVLLLESLDQRGGFEHVLRLHHLGEANPLDTRTDDGLEVRLEPKRRKRIHTYVSARPAARFPERSGNHAARVRLFCRQHAILDIEEDGIGIRRHCLSDEALPVTRHEHP